MQKKPKHVAITSDLLIDTVQYITTTPTGCVAYGTVRDLIARLQMAQPVALDEDSQEE
jgi:hypothetical protein